MAKTFLFIFISAGFIFLFNKLNFSFETNVHQPQNNTPVVKIISPQNNMSVAGGSQLHYSITVSDKEDGESKYDEINTKEVLLEVKYISDSVKLSEALKKSNAKDPAGLTAIRTSNCFNCHGFDSKLIGPGFTEIRKRYQATAANIELLEKRIRQGSTGVWGKVSMPSHPELSKEQIQDIVKFIVENAAEKNVHYYVGTEGLIPVPKSETSTALLLIASYTDHGISNKGDRLKGEDIEIIKIK